MPPPEKLRPATAADVAALAGVSRATVSHILSGRDARFPDDTKNRVKQAASQLRYRPWASGRSLVRGRSDTIVVLLPGATIAGMKIQEAIEGITQGLASPGSNVVLRIADADPDSTVEALINLQPMAVVDTGALPQRAHTRLQELGIMTVPDGSRPLRHHGMTVDSAIAEMQVSELVRRGTRRIVYAGLADARRDVFGPGRIAALTAACERRGLEPPLHIPVPLNIEKTMERMAEIGPLPVGIAAYNDETAAAVLGASARLGLSIPEDVSVIGFDNSDIARLWTPRITTIEFDMGIFVTIAVDELRAQISGEDELRPGRDYDILKLIPGSST